MNPLNDSTSPGWLAGLVVAIPAAIVTLQKLMKGWSADRASRAGYDASTAITEGQVVEIARLQALNKFLSEELGKMQVSVAKLAGDNLRLQNEISELQARLAHVLAASTAAS